MIDEKLAFSFFTSTKGHFGQKYLYRYTLKRLEEKLPFFSSFFKVAHIKVTPGEEKLAQEIEEDLYEFGFYKVLKTTADWKHNDSSHAIGYYKDMMKVYSYPELREYPYLFAWEDDYLMQGENVENLLYEAVSFLRKNIDALCVRINKDCDSDTSKTFQAAKNILGQRVDHTAWGPTVTFQPTIFKTAPWVYSVQLINNNLDVLKTRHCELVSGDAMKNFTNSKTPFYLFDPKVLNVKHIGEEGMEEILNNQ